jgi:hypothetical protein
MAKEHLRVVDNATSQEGHNSAGNLPVDQDEAKYTWLKDQIVKAEAGAEAKKVEFDQAKALVKKARKTFEAHGGSLAEFDLARELADMSNPDQARARLVRLINYLQFEGIELPDGVSEAAAVDPYHSMPPSEREKSLWFERGRIAGLTGKGAFASTPPEGCPPDMYQEWANGVNAAHEEIASKMAMAGPLFEAADKANAATGLKVEGDDGDGEEGETAQDGDEPDEDGGADESADESENEDAND